MSVSINLSAKRSLVTTRPPMISDVSAICMNLSDALIMGGLIKFREKAEALTKERKKADTARKKVEKKANVG